MLKHHPLKTILLLLICLLTPLMASGDIDSPYYYFRRETKCAGDCTPIRSISIDTFEIIKEKALPEVSFHRSQLFKFDNAGTCTAMALDFITRYLSEYSPELSSFEIETLLTNFAPFYTSNLPTFSSRQAAFNTISVNKKAYKKNPELYRYRKIQSLANYHYLTLTPMTPTFFRREISMNPELINEAIDNLPCGAYIIRTTIPAKNHKMEQVGHTMILLKQGGTTVYYDNAEGAVDISHEMATYVLNKIFQYNHAEFRIYQAEHQEGAPYHLCTEINPLL